MQAPIRPLSRIYACGDKENLPLRRPRSSEFAKRAQAEKAAPDPPRRGPRPDDRAAGRHAPEAPAGSSSRRGAPAHADAQAALFPLRSMPRLPQPSPHVSRVKGLRRSLDLVCQSSGQGRAPEGEGAWARRIVGRAAPPEPAWALPDAGRLGLCGITGDSASRSSSAPLPADAPPWAASVAGSAGFALSRQRKELRDASSLPPEENRLRARRQALAFGTLGGHDGSEPAAGPEGQMATNVLQLFASTSLGADEAKGRCEPGHEEREDDGEEDRESEGAGHGAALAPSLREALARYEREEFEQGEVQRMRAAYRRFILDSTSELSRGSLHDALLHLGYMSVSAQQAEDIAATVSQFSTFDFPEFCLFVEKCAQQERAAVQRALAAWHEGDTGGVEGLQRLLRSLGVVTTAQPVRETLELAGLDAAGVGLSIRELLHFLAAWRVQEGFAAEDVARARAAHERLVAASSGLPRASELAPGLLRFAGLHCVGHMQLLLERLPPGFGCKSDLTFSEFLVWARRLRDMDMSELWNLFLHFDSHRDGLIQASRVHHLLSEVGFSLLSEEVVEFMKEAGVQHGHPLDFNAMVQLVQVCRRSSGFTRSEANELVTVFRRFDVHRSGELPRLQVLDMLRFLGHTTGLEEVHRYINEVDFNKNGTMDEREYLMLMRHRREQDFRRARAVFDSLRAGSEGLPRGELGTALARLGQEPQPAVLQDALRAAGDGPAPVPAGGVSAGGDCPRMPFEAFVRTAEQCRSVAAAEGRRRAGMSNKHFNLLRYLFDANDPARRGFINLGDLVRMLSSCDMPVNTVQGRQTMFKSLDVARAAAIEAGVQAGEVGEPGSPQVRFWELVHFVRALVREREERMVAREKEVLAEARFSATEAAHFREVFASMVRECRVDSEEHIPEIGQEPVPALGDVLHKFSAVSVLPRQAFMRGMCSIGLRISAHQRAQLDQRLAGMAAAHAGLDFAGFLQVIRWMLDIDFAGIHKAAEKEVERLKHQGKDFKPFAKSPESESHTLFGASSMPEIKKCTLPT